MTHQSKNAVALILWCTLLLVGTFTLAHQATARPHQTWGGELEQDTVLDPENNPHIVTRELIVPAGITLTLKPGVEIQFAPAVALIVRGRLLAEGTPTQTIRFTHRDPDTYGSRIVLDETNADNRIKYAEIEYMEGFIAQYSTIHVSHSEIHNLHGDGLGMTAGTIIIQNNHIHHIDCVAPLICEGIHIRNTLPKKPALILDNHVHHIDDDCLDSNEATLIAERNVLHHCGDKGISIGPPHEHGAAANLAALLPSSATLINNLIYSTTYGIAVKDNAFAHIIHNTIINTKDGLALYESHDHAGYGAGQAKVVNTILWHNERNIWLDPDANPPAELTVTYSDVEGGWKGDGNLDLDPMFRSPTAEDFHLQDASPLIDAGTDTNTTVDLAGQPRSVGNAPDIGAYEAQGSALSLWGYPGNQEVYLTWHFFNPALASFSISYTLIPKSTMSLMPPSVHITHLLTSTRAYTLTDLTNYVWYRIMVEAWDTQDTRLQQSNVVLVMPTDIYVYLPTVLRRSQP